MNSRHPDRISPNSSPNTARIQPALRRIDTVKGTAIGAITYEFNGPGWHVDEFLRELAANSDVIDFGTAAKPVAYADAVAGHASYAEDRAHDPLAADTATAPAASAAAHEGANA